MRRITSLVTSIAVATSLLVAGVPVATQAVDVPQKRNDTQLVKLRVKGCKNCVVVVQTPYYYEDGREYQDFYRRIRLKKGKAQFWIDSFYLAQASFLLPAQKKFKRQGFATGLAFRYQGIKKGKKVTARRAAKRSYAYTQLLAFDYGRTVTIRARVNLFKHKYQGKRLTTARFWASPSMKTWNDRERAKHGLVIRYH